MTTHERLWLDYLRPSKSHSASHHWGFCVGLFCRPMGAPWNYETASHFIRPNVFCNFFSNTDETRRNQSTSAASGFDLHLRRSNRLLDDNFVYIKRDANQTKLVDNYDALIEQYTNCFYRNEYSAVDLCDGNMVSRLFFYWSNVISVPVSLRIWISIDVGGCPPIIFLFFCFCNSRFLIGHISEAFWITNHGISSFIRCRIDSAKHRISFMKRSYRVHRRASALLNDRRRRMAIATAHISQTCSMTLTHCRTIDTSLCMPNANDATLHPVRRVKYRTCYLSKRRSSLTKICSGTWPKIIQSTLKAISFVSLWLWSMGWIRIIPLAKLLVYYGCLLVSQ